MMPLLSEREPDDLDELLVGVKHYVKHVVETHPSEDADCHYTFLIWLNDTDDGIHVADMVRKNVANKRREDPDDPWETTVYNFGGLIVVDTYL